VVKSWEHSQVILLNIQLYKIEFTHVFAKFKVYSSRGPSVSDENKVEAERKYLKDELKVI
jgi:hypothetical protein